tara:strand:- start:1 stop:528 length:528 start_codon:yes stop_codon:yes gene_type:complete
MMLASYIFKPRSLDIAAKVIESFCNDFLHYGHEGFYVHWRDNPAHNKLPDGYVEFWIETENGNMDVFTETSFNDEPLTAQDLTDNLFAFLDDNFWEDDCEGGKLYTFYERELSEVVSALSVRNSRVIAFEAGRNAWVHDIGQGGNGHYHRVDMVEHLLNADLPKKSNRQLTLPLA